MADEKTIEVFFNPFLLMDIEIPSITGSEEKVTLESIINFICTPTIGSDIDSLVARYKEINKEKKLSVAPYEQRLLDKLIWPLRHAKAGYMIGNYLGTIALCGMVAEMIAVLLFEVSEFKLNDKPMTVKEQASVFGSTFEKLGQDRRVQILHAYGLIDDDIKKAFDLIRTTRKRYLHLWSQDHDRLPPDSIDTFYAAISIAESVIGQNIKDGKIILNPSLVKYLKQQGVYKDSEH